MVRAPIKPPHMPRQCPPPSRPRTNAESSRGSSSITLVGLVVALCCLLEPGLVSVVFVIEPSAVRRAAQVTVLAAVHGPEEYPARQGNQHDSDGDQNVERGQRAAGKCWDKTTVQAAMSFILLQDASLV